MAQTPGTARARRQRPARLGRRDARVPAAVLVLHRASSSRSSSARRSHAFVDGHRQRRRLPGRPRLRGCCCSARCSCTSSRTRSRPAPSGRRRPHIVLDLWGGHTAFAEEIRHARPQHRRRGRRAADQRRARRGLRRCSRRLATGRRGRPRRPAACSRSPTASSPCSTRLPGLPLDGGRVLEGVVWAVSRRRGPRARVAGRLDRAGGRRRRRRVVRRPAPALRLPAGRHHRGLVARDRAGCSGTGPPGRSGYARFRRAAQAVAVGPAHAARGHASRRPRASPTRGPPPTPSAPYPPATGVVAPEPLVVVLDGYGNPAGIVDEAAAAAVPPERAGAGAGRLGRPRPAAARRSTPQLAGEDLLARAAATRPPRSTRSSTAAGSSGCSTGATVGRDGRARADAGGGRLDSRRP